MSFSKLSQAGINLIIPGHVTSRVDDGKINKLFYSVTSDLPTYTKSERAVVYVRPPLSMVCKRPILWVS